ncbi:hypothetical protein J6590_044690 [Homalodisca vitripennis]|nr:hypothetical protein J6590_044690 [Homalodisca vitripennis]
MQINSQHINYCSRYSVVKVHCGSDVTRDVDLVLPHATRDVTPPLLTERDATESEVSGISKLSCHLRPDNIKSSRSKYLRIDKRQQFGNDVSLCAPHLWSFK